MIKIRLNTRRNDMGGKYGNAELKRLLEITKSMTTEEYKALYERTLKDIEEIKTGVSEYQILRYHDPKTKTKFHVEYCSSQMTVFISCDDDQTTFDISDHLGEFYSYRGKYTFASDNPGGYDVEEIEMADAA